MKRLISWSIDHHWIVIVLSTLLLAAGVWTARQMPFDVFPDLTAPTVTILAEGHGMAPEEMESLVTFPIESAINGASGVRRVRSATAVGIGVIWVEFDWGTDIYIARQLVAERLALVAGTLPPQIERPVLAPISSIMGEILFFAISSEHGGSARVADAGRYGCPPAPAGRPGSVAGDAHRRGRATVPGDRASAGASGQCRLAHRTARGGTRRERERLSGHLHGRTAGVRAAGGRTREERRRDWRQRRGHARYPLRPGARRRRCPGGRGTEARRGIAQRQTGGHRWCPEAAGRQHDRCHEPARSRARRPRRTSCPRG